jgi:ribosomal-protein-alanine N-acetyltransferase
MAATDIDAVTAIAAGVKDAPQWPRSGYETAFAPEAWPQRIALVAETANSTIAGFLVAALIPPSAELESIAVSPRFQRQGLARQLLRRLLDDIRPRQCSEVLLEVRPSNQAGLAFYGALGFQETGRRPAYYADPVEDALLMRLGVGGA